MRANQMALLAPLAIFGAGVVGLGYYFSFSGAEGAFHDNLVPELLGFCLEGFFMVGLLSLLQTMRERAYRRELWLSLRGALRGVLSTLDIAMLAPNAEPTPTDVLEQEQKIVGRFRLELQNTHLGLHDLVSIKRESIEALAMIRDMVPIAAQLSARHMRWWIAIVNSMRLLSEAQTRASVEQSIYKLLENIEEFDQVHY